MGRLIDRLREIFTLETPVLVAHEDVEEIISSVDALTNRVLDNYEVQSSLFSELPERHVPAEMQIRDVIVATIVATLNEQSKNSDIKYAHVSGYRNQINFKFYGNFNDEVEGEYTIPSPDIEASSLAEGITPEEGYYKDSDLYVEMKEAIADAIIDISLYYGLDAKEVSNAIHEAKMQFPVDYGNSHLVHDGMANRANIPPLKPKGFD